MAEVMGLLADGPLRVAAFEREAPGLQGKKAAERAQQARLAGAVGPVTMSAEPSSASNESPSKSRRPPRSIANPTREGALNSLDKARLPRPG